MSIIYTTHASCDIASVPAISLSRNIMSAVSLYQIAGTVASQLRLNLSKVLKLQGLMKPKCLARSQEWRR